jgi:hypothetical protein
MPKLSLQAICHYLNPTIYQAPILAMIFLISCSFRVWVLVRGQLTLIRRDASIIAKVGPYHYQPEGDRAVLLLLPPIP